MRPLELLVVYLLLGVAVAGAMARGGHPGAAYALPLWPLFLPGLLVRVAPPAPSAEGAGRGSEVDRIEAAVEGLRGALLAWETAPVGLNMEAPLAAVRRGLRALELRYVLLQRALSEPRNDRNRLQKTWEAAPEAARGLFAVQLHSLDQLEALREEARLELERGLAAVGELATRVELARFSGGASTDVAEQLTLLAAAVDGVSEVRRLSERRGANPLA